MYPSSKIFTTSLTLTNICIHFQVNQTLTIHEDDCPHLNEGCICDENNGMRREELICSLAGAKCPDLAACSSPLKPIGHCCYSICGAIIYVQKPWNSIDIPFNLNGAKNDIEALINPPPPRKGFNFKSKSFGMIVTSVK